MELANRRIVLGVTGGVAAYKAAVLARDLMARGASVQVVMTAAGQRFVGAETFQALTGQPVFSDAWDARIENRMPHIELSRRADVVLVAPASADFLARIAHGLCDDLLATLCLARDCPLLVAPAMNRQMWEHPATRRNVATLRDDGVGFIGPDSGVQACGETGEGRMLEPSDIAEHLCAHFTPKRFAGRRVLLTAGPTFEPIDPVRGITNLSSGKMGFALARALAFAGAKVTLVAGPTTLPTPFGTRRLDVTTAMQMHDAVMAEVGGADLFIGVAAVADWRVANASKSKLKKTAGGAPPDLQFALNPDILAAVASLPAAPYCVGFAAESEDLERNGQAKRAAKGVPLLCANIGHATFGRDDNELLLIDEAGLTRLERADKNTLAARLVLEIANRLEAAAPDRPKARKSRARRRGKHA
ncbi:MAG: bifunctional phosphopantothenoylcysteine decarboxylase/phosphopantothenate--cysteine ligase CoaBC [Burkholderiaceae bacterium]|nr:bifunctional phosphopantothenoylcysteine decarboxylase/phosphopantothenate--cysteine ligase CoaBC [Burkholderiaceae bacterium]